MTKRYTVIYVPTKDGPTYRIYDRINQCSIEGGFEIQKWAESVAEMMEEKWEHDSTPKRTQIQGSKGVPLHRTQELQNPLS